MYNVIFYKDKKGREPVKDYIVSLKAKRTKDSSIKFNKILDYLDLLEEHGTRAGEPYMKHLDGEIWELRPLKDRILFFAYDGNSFVLLSQFRKMTQKTPKREIAKAKRRMNDFMERGLDDE